MCRIEYLIQDDIEVRLLRAGFSPLRAAYIAGTIHGRRWRVNERHLARTGQVLAPDDLYGVR